MRILLFFILFFTVSINLYSDQADSTRVSHYVKTLEVFNIPATFFLAPKTQTQITNFSNEETLEDALAKMPYSVGWIQNSENKTRMESNLSVLFAELAPILNNLPLLEKNLFSKLNRPYTLSELDSFITNPPWKYFKLYPENGAGLWTTSAPFDKNYSSQPVIMIDFKGKVMHLEELNAVKQIIKRFIGRVFFDRSYNYINLRYHHDKFDLPVPQLPSSKFLNKTEDFFPLDGFLLDLAIFNFGVGAISISGESGYLIKSVNEQKLNFWNRDAYHSFVLGKESLAKNFKAEKSS